MMKQTVNYSLDSRQIKVTYTITFTQKRKTKSNRPRGKKRSSGSYSSDPTSVTPSQRVIEYPKKPFEVSNHKLFCYGCREELNLKRTTIANHVRSKKHEQGKVKLLRNVENKK